MNHPNDTVFLHGRSEKMDLSVFNPMTTNLFGVAIKKGKGEIREVYFYGNKDYMLGHICFPYKNLKFKW